ncbi:MAG: hypothetical protein OXI79_02140 [Gammaproteobacteria bacterium]|nr:hypothetical protein [Gammaproteobacteria bacterium]
MTCGIVGDALVASRANCTEGAGEDKPRAGEDKPRAGEDKPRAGEDKPRAGEDKPRAGEDKPRAGEDKPRPYGAAFADHIGRIRLTRHGFRLL